jgi:ACS family hexuronate transporter-like MFS transporter
MEPLDSRHAGRMTPPVTPDGPVHKVLPMPLVGAFRWVILGLLFCATSINYADRFLLGVLKPIIVHDLRWSETDYANVIFCFQLAYAIGLLTISRIIDKLGVRYGMALVVGLCALAAASHSLVGSVLGFALARFALGFGEAGAWPGCAKAVSEWFPRKERAIGMGVVNAGSAVGATITPMVVPLILQLVAWPFAFLFTASLDLIWLVVWLVNYRRPESHKRLTATELNYIRSDPAPPEGEVSWLQLFGHRQTWAFLLAKGLSDPVWWFYLFWVPGFLAQKYHLTTESAAASAAAMAFPILVVYVMADIGSVAGGWLSMQLINGGCSINVARKSVMLGCAFCVLPVFLVAQPIGLWPSVFLIGLAAAAHLGFSANLFTVATDTVPRHAISSVAGIGGLAAAIGGMFVAKFVGYVLDTTHSYAIPFAVASCAYFAALGLLQLLLPRLEPMRLKAVA